MLNSIGLAIGGVLEYISLRLLELFGHEPFIEVEPMIFKALFEAIKSIFLG